MSFHSIRYRAYGNYGNRSYATATTDDDIIKPIVAVPDFTRTIPTPVPVVEKPTSSRPRTDDDHDDRRPFLPHLIPGCKADPGSAGFKYTQNGKTTTGSTCEIAKLNWDIRYGNNNHNDDHHDDDHHDNNHSYTFRGLVRCSNPKKKGCFRVVMGRDLDDARRNFCKLFGFNGRCNGDPRFVIQEPPVITVIDRRYVVLAADDDLPDATPVAQAQQETQSQSVTINNPPPPPLDPAPASPAAGSGLDSILSGSIGGISTPLVIGGGMMLLMMMMMMRK